MWAIASYYNPARSERRLANYRVFRKYLEIPLVTVELAFDGHFELMKDDADILIQISGGAVLWQKERLLNVAISSVPAGTNSIAWLDCDVVFDRSDWAVEAQALLESYNAVQLYSSLVDLAPEVDSSGGDYSGIPESGRGIASFVSDGGLVPSEVGLLLHKGRAAGGHCMGLAWAARRGILEAHGLYDAMIMGSGDRLLVGTMYGQFQEVVEVFELNALRREHYLRWARGYHEAVADRIGYVCGRAYHLWHGNSMHRKTLDRHRWLARFEFDPTSDLTIGSNGAWQWARSKPALAEFLANYLNDRG